MVVGGLVHSDAVAAPELEDHQEAYRTMESGTSEDRWDRYQECMLPCIRPSTYSSRSRPFQGLCSTLWIYSRPLVQNSQVLVLVHRLLYLGHW